MSESHHAPRLGLQAHGLELAVITRALRKWLDNFVGSDEERYVADALLALVDAAERSAGPPHIEASLWSLAQALKRSTL